MKGPTTTVFARPLEHERPPAPDAAKDLFDRDWLRRYVEFSARSVRRRPLLFAFVSCGMIIAAATALVALPKTYEVQSRLLAQKNPVLAVRADATQIEPTRAAAETITSRDNLQALMAQTDLLAESRRHRAPALRLQDWALQKLNRVPSEKDLADELIGFLEKNLVVSTTPDGMITTRLQWPDPVMAYRLVDAAQQNFLEKRHVLEVSTIVEQISILEAHAERLKNEVDAQVAALQRLQERSAPARPRAAPVKREVAADPESDNLRVRLSAKRRAIADLEEFRQRHLMELQTRLIEQRAVHSENHPVVADLERSIELLRRESPEISALRQEEAELRRTLADSPEPASGGAAGANAGTEWVGSAYPQEDSAVEYGRSQLRFATQQYAAIRDRISAAKIDLDTARAAFKYRYSVVAPPEIPRGPIKPNAPLVVIAAVIAGALLALFATTAADLRSGVVLERWQVEQLLPPSHFVIELQLAEPGAGETSASGTGP
jgi:hypothetical protein